MRFKSAIQFTAVCLLGLATAVIAQQPGQGQGQQGRRGGGGGPPGGGMFGGGMFGGGFISRMFLARNDAVRKELELADEQVAEIDKVNEELRAKYPSMFGGRGGGGPPGGGPGGRRGGGTNNNNNEGASLAVPTPWYFVVAQDPQQGQGRGRGPQFTPEQMAEMEKARLERTREENAKLAEILLPNQLKRLNEIYVQQAGVAALQDEDIAKQLTISDAQKAQLTKIRDEFSAKRREMFQPGGGGGGDFEAARAKIIEMNKVQDEQLLAVLNPQQKAKFEEMKGKPFTMPEGGFGRGGGPGGNRGRTTNRGTNN
jgi:hypothetical protein